MATDAHDPVSAWIMIPPERGSTGAIMAVLEAWSDWLEAAGVPVTRVRQNSGPIASTTPEVFAHAAARQSLPRWILIPEAMLAGDNQPMSVPFRATPDSDGGDDHCEPYAPLVFLIPSDASPPWHLLNPGSTAAQFEPVSLALLAAGLTLLPRTPATDG